MDFFPEDGRREEEKLSRAAAGREGAGLPSKEDDRQAFPVARCGIFKERKGHGGREALECSAYAHPPLFGD